LRQPETSSIRERVQRVLAEEVGPALHMDGSGLEVLDVTDGVVQVRLRGGDKADQLVLDAVTGDLLQKLDSNNGG